MDNDQVAVAGEGQQERIDRTKLLPLANCACVPCLHVCLCLCVYMCKFCLFPRVLSPISGILALPFFYLAPLSFSAFAVVQSWAYSLSLFLSFLSFLIAPFIFCMHYSIHVQSGGSITICHFSIMNNSVMKYTVQQGNGPSPASDQQTA